jgi:hypothetical protein
MFAAKHSLCGLMLDLPDSFWESQQYSIDDEIYPLRYGDYADDILSLLWQFDIVSENGMSTQLV